MYSLPHFKENDPAVIKAFLQDNPFAMLVGSDAANHPVATQVPLLVEEKNGAITLVGHIMRKTDHHLAFEHNPNVLAIFTGPHTYVSASWYTNKHTASTWNYMTVQARGAIRFLEDADLLQILTRLTAHFENNPHSPSLVEKMDKAYVDQMMKAIIAFEIRVTALDNVFKLSQNRDAESYRHIVKQLKERGEGGAAIAAEMEKRGRELLGR